jgi:hypothetical protein
MDWAAKIRQDQERFHPSLDVKPLDNKESKVFSVHGISQNRSNFLPEYAKQAAKNKRNKFDAVRSTHAMIRELR